ncbi:MAG: anti-sigma factor antagonist [Elusimicrobia bacterium]|nr:anti-sigma factor antagonist [Elusimicrobiota bacterium]MBD3412243.1 anti-sigma factor antagonist [Elusimicrobiota bacterium]
MPELKIDQSHSRPDEPTVLYLDGFVDSATVFDLRKKLDDLASGEPVRLVVDFSKLTYLGSAGISAFIEYSSALRDKGGDLVICCVAEKVMKVLTMVGMEKIIPVHPTQKDALASFRPSTEPQPVPEQAPAKPKTEFPVKRDCPHCKKDAMVAGPEVFRCHFCHKLFYVNEQGETAALGVDGTDTVKDGVWFTMQIPSNIVYLNSVRAFLTSILGESGYGSNADTSEIELAVDEAVANVMEHAYGMDKTRSLRITIFLTNEYILVKLRDHGLAFDLAEKVKEEEQTVGTQRKRGRGCYIIKKVMDKLEYQSIPDVGNELVMLRYFKKHVTAHE